MRKILSAFALFLSLSGLGFGPASASAQVPADDTREVQRVVREQLAAFAADDAERAFSLASASIRAMFGTAAQFMQMVRSSYPVVYRPASVAFMQPKPDDDVVVQPVHMTDQGGHSWIAYYRLQRQQDSGWRIAGCVLVPNTGKTV